ncbi:hypothetical protein QYF61_022401 [Mycteria americana]|uniref:Keratin n=1 Tax=Mycteria americana TaxID=33587 RepID=A0AAN7N8R4_MYCAM|nr:hypothetical protein QYF61_022401 [Mycteria americana]
MDDSFITQVTEEPRRTGALLDLIHTKKEGLVGDVKIKGSLGCSGKEMVEFRILRGGRKKRPLVLGQVRATIKASPGPHCLIHFSHLLLLGNQCLPCWPCDPTPLANSCNEPYVMQCQYSTVVIEPPPVVVALPGPILSSFPQNTVVGSSTSAAVGSILNCDGVPITSGCCDLSGISSCYCGRSYNPL